MVIMNSVMNGSVERIENNESTDRDRKLYISCRKESPPLVLTFPIYTTGAGKICSFCIIHILNLLFMTLFCPFYTKNLGSRLYMSLVLSLLQMNGVRKKIYVASRIMVSNVAFLFPPPPLPRKGNLNNGA